MTKTIFYDLFFLFFYYLIFLLSVFLIHWICFSFIFENNQIYFFILIDSFLKKQKKRQRLHDFGQNHGDACLYPLPFLFIVEKKSYFFICFWLKKKQGSGQRHGDAVLDLEFFHSFFFLKILNFFYLFKKKQGSGQRHGDAVLGLEFFHSFFLKKNIFIYLFIKKK